MDPGESYGRTLTWDQLEIDNFPSFTSRQVQPGTYFVFGKTGPGPIFVKPYEQQIDKIETDKIEIQVRP